MSRTTMESSRPVAGAGINKAMQKTVAMSSLTATGSRRSKLLDRLTESASILARIDNRRALESAGDEQHMQGRGRPPAKL